MFIASKKSSSRIFIYSVCCFLLISYTACTVSLLPTYSAELEAQITSTSKMTDMLYLEIMDAPDDKKVYSVYADKYRQIETEINSILLKNEVRTNADDFIASAKALKEYFVQAKEDHKKRNTLSNPELLIYNEQLKALWKPVLIEEMALSKLKY
ncbi:MAG: hypothetical protein ABJA79_04070 [Parafilimonas sp.]